MQFLTLTKKDIRNILIILGATLLLTSVYFLVSDFPLIPYNLTASENNDNHLSELTDVQPVDFETFISLREMDSTLIIDTRSKKEFQDGHIPKAINIPYEERKAYFPLLEQMDTVQRIITYCEGGSCMTSMALAEELMYIFPDVYVFLGGWNAWIEGNNPIEKGMKGHSK
ncbi:MAG: rhodanese-like domain-containing protein [Candidatus Marinimicrobia bacterium]|nr:rhodanese-like domain-containing protein [Candidatus Neomarinimicrobiota bacterium]